VEDCGFIVASVCVCLGGGVIPTLIKALQLEVLELWEGAYPIMQLQQWFQLQMEEERNQGWRQGILYFFFF
jgi:hypothetical protein